MRLEAIILAAGSGSRMVELTRGRPKCLLPVGNQCMIWYAITGLKAVGVERFIILVPDIHEQDIKQYCSKKFNPGKDLNLEFISVPTKADHGTAESILSIKNKIRRDFIVHSCDSIVDTRALQFLINHYRLYDPMMTMLLSENPSYFAPRSVPGRREKEHYTRDVIALEALDKLNLTASDGFSANKIVFLHSERDLKQNLRIKNRELALHPSLEVHSHMLDAHIYVFKRQMLDFMSQNTDKAVLKGELIPLVVAKQFSSFKLQGGQDYIEDDVVDEIKIKTTECDYELELQQKLDSFSPHNVVRSSCFETSKSHKPFSCHALVVKNLITYRVNTLGSYLDSNRDARAILNSFGLKNLNFIKDSVVGEATTVGEKCMLKKSSVGSNCKIGDKVKLIDCIVMDNVEIESNVNLSECIIGTSSKIGTKCDLKSCIIGAKQVVGNGRKANSELIIDDAYVIDLSDPINADVD